MPARHFLIFGPPGVGKGTQSRKLVERHGVCHVSTGDMLRSLVSAKKMSPLGKRAKRAMAKGLLLPDGLMIRMVKQRLRQDRACRRRGWLLDGFPRSPGQAHAMLAAGLVPERIIVLNASTEVVVERALARAAAAKAAGEVPRADDTAATMRKRLGEYETNKDATLAALRSYLRVATIDGGGTELAVGGAIADALSPTASQTDSNRSRPALESR